MIDCSKLLFKEASASPSLHAARDRGPVIVWNMTNRCNLECRHCYIEARDSGYKGELTTGEAKALIRGLAEVKIPVLLFSGGEPLLRDDIYELGASAASSGIRTALSTNGVLITQDAACRIKEANFGYVGVSIDGAEAAHDRFRNKKGAFESAIKGIRNCLEAGLKCGVRFTVNKSNFSELEAVLDMVERERIPRFCMYHLVYAGRGRGLVGEDITREESREVIETLLDKVKEWHDKGFACEVLTTDNHADGVYILNRIKDSKPARVGEVTELLRLHGGCSAGVRIASIDPYGDVHPCQFWNEVTLGNVKEKGFGDIWEAADNALLNALRSMNGHLKGKCGRCSYNKLCGGCRIRARAVYGDEWAEDPACYLTEEEITG